MLTVHHLQCSQSERIIWLCEELGIPFDLQIHQRDPVFSPPELKALSPLGAAPVLIDDYEPNKTTETKTPAFKEDGITNNNNGRAPPLVLSESGAVVEYIIHKHGDGHLALPPTHKDYAQYLYWFHVSNGNLQPCIYRAMLVANLKLKEDHPVRKSADTRLTLVVGLLDRRLRTVPWLGGDEFSAADIMNVFSLSTMRMFFPMDLSAYPGILAWLRRVGERPAYRRAMRKGDPTLTPCLDAAPPSLFSGLATVTRH